MMIRVYFLLILGILLLWSSNYGEKDGIQEILNYNKKMIENGKPKSGKVYCLDYNQNVMYWDIEENENFEINVKNYVSTEQTHSITKSVSTYIDEQLVFTVMHSLKKLIVSANPNPERDESALNRFISNQSYIIKRCKLIEYSINKEKNLKTIVLDASELDIQGIYIQKMYYYFNTKNGQLSKIVTRYSRDYEIDRLSIVFNRIDFNNGYKFPKDLKKWFLTSNGKQVKKYNNYELIKN